MANVIITIQTSVKSVVILVQNIQGNKNQKFADNLLLKSLTKTLTRTSTFSTLIKR